MPFLGENLGKRMVWQRGVSDRVIHIILYHWVILVKSIKYLSCQLDTASPPVNQ